MCPQGLAVRYGYGEHGTGLKQLGCEILQAPLIRHCRVARTDWAAPELTSAQRTYAAADALVGRALLVHLHSAHARDADVLQFTAPFTDRARVRAPKSRGAGAPCPGKARAHSHVRRAPLYDSCRLLSPDGRVLCHCPRKKVQWYVARGLAELVQSEPTLVGRLTFAPAGAGREGDDFYLALKKNQCVVCGAADGLVRHNVVPAEYRRCFPLELKAHKSHDILLLCANCQPKVHRINAAEKERVAEEYRVPGRGTCARRTKDKRVDRAVNFAALLLRCDDARLAVSEHYRASPVGPASATAAAPPAMEAPVPTATATCPAAGDAAPAAAAPPPRAAAPAFTAAGAALHDSQVAMDLRGRQGANASSASCGGVRHPSGASCAAVPDAEGASVGAVGDGVDSVSGASRSAGHAAQACGALGGAAGASGGTKPKKPFRLPDGRVREMMADICEFLAVEQVLRADLQKVQGLDPYIENTEFQSHGDVVVQQLKTLADFGRFTKRWRRAFVEGMRPQFLPEKWDVDYEEETFAVKVPVNSKRGTTLEGLGLTPAAGCSST